MFLCVLVEARPSHKKSQSISHSSIGAFSRFTIDENTKDQSSQHDPKGDKNGRFPRVSGSVSHPFDDPSRQTRFPPISVTSPSSSSSTSNPPPDSPITPNAARRNQTTKNSSPPDLLS